MAEVAMHTEKTFDTGQVTIHYSEGPQAGPPMVLLHGLTSSEEIWQSILPDITASWHVYNCSLRGHGKSGRVAGHYHLIDYAPDTITFIRGVIGKPSVLVGHSLGALISLAVAAQAPDVVCAQILLDPPLTIRNAPVSIQPPVEQWFRFVYELNKEPLPLEDAMARCKPMLGPNASDAAAREMALYVQSIAADAPLTAADNTLLDGFDISAALDRIKCPTLLISGNWDRGGAIRDEDMTFFREHAPHATIAYVPDAGHNVHGEQPAEVLAHIHAFLATLPLV